MAGEESPTTTPVLGEERDTSGRSLRSLVARLRSLFTSGGRGVIGGLDEEHADPDPIRQFSRWFEEAKRAGLYLPEAMVVATATLDGRPSARTMLLKGFGEDGFRFYTNYESRKGKELAENPRAALLLHWNTLHRQVRVEGKVKRLRSEESAAYFHTRPRGSQISAWASRQSSVIAGRDELERSFRELEERFRKQEPPLPEFWGGFSLHPERMEFWQGRVNRLHDRLLYERQADGWRIVRLAP